MSCCTRRGVMSFLSTPSARRATGLLGRPRHCPAYFYPRPPRGGRRAACSFSVRLILFLSTPSARRATFLFVDLQVFFGISIHALREEGDGFCLIAHRPIRISIHALREEGDHGSKHDAGHGQYFYPRPPRGGRRVPCDGVCQTIEDFYPRPPRGGRQQKQRQNLYFLINYTTFCTNLEEP